MIDEQQVYCPYCGEEFTALIDASAGDQYYIEDCEVCCRPIEFMVSSNGDSILDIQVRTADE